MKQTPYLKEMSWLDFEERRKTTRLAIIPSGAFEVYGPHLPLGTDTLVANKIAGLVAERVNGIVGPVLEVGDSLELEDFPGTITIQGESFKQYMWDALRSLEKWGFTDFLFINTHLGNVPIITQIAFEFQRKEGIRCAQIDYWRFIQSHCDGIIESGELAHAHASEAGTSVMMYLFPELVDVSRLIHEPPKFEDSFPDIIVYRPFRAYTNSGTIGNAALGTREKGEAIVTRSVERIVQFVKETWYPEKEAAGMSR